MNAANFNDPVSASPEPDAQRSLAYAGPRISSLEQENSGLRQLVIELLEKNQRLREQLDQRKVA